MMDECGGHVLYTVLLGKDVAEDVTSKGRRRSSEQRAREGAIDHWCPICTRRHSLRTLGQVRGAACQEDQSSAPHEGIVQASCLSALTWRLK